MKNISLGALVGWFLFAAPGSGAEQLKSKSPEISIIDYVAQLPPGAFEGTASQTLNFIRGPGSIVDKKNGYIRCKGDGGQGDFEVALFRYRDGRPLVVVSTGNTEEGKWTYLQFFEVGAAGKMQRITDSIFPLADSGRGEDGQGSGKWRFELPRYGKTILARNPDSGKLLYKITWTGEKFVKEK
jgi:hypothetical protein